VPSVGNQAEKPHPLPGVKGAERPVTPGETVAKEHRLDAGGRELVKRELRASLLNVVR
jgi:hypothetical protein